MTDTGVNFSKTIGWTAGERTGRYALIIDHGKILYAEKESTPGEVSVSLYLPLMTCLRIQAKRRSGFWSRRRACKALDLPQGREHSPVEPVFLCQTDIIEA